MEGIVKKKIVITGMGAVTPIGSGVEEYWNRLIAGACGIDKIRQFDATELAVRIAAEVHSFDLEKYMPKKMIHETDAFTQYAYVAAAEALAMAAGSGGQRECSESDLQEPNRQDCESLQGDSARSIPLPADPDRTGIVMGTAMAGVATTAATQEILTNAVHKNVGPRFVPRILGNIAAAQIAIAHGITGHSVTLSTACASGGDAISAGAMLLQAEEADAVLAVGAESILCPLVIYSLANAHTLSRMNDDPLHSCRPFDAERSGFVIGEGGGALVLETEENALARGATIYAELAGWANNNDAYHVIKPNPDGISSVKCMQKALRQAGLSPQQIDYINAHGTGTKLGDGAELNALGQLFGDKAADGLQTAADQGGATGRPAISSTKGATGHMMGAGGITESIACIQAIREGIVPPTLNLKQCDSDLNFVREQSRRLPVDIAMTNAFGFGGQNSSLIFRKY